MAKIQSVWAIDIGQAALKALKIAPGGDAEHVTAEAFDFIEYPKLLSQPDADPEELVREALATFTDRNDLKGCRVAIAVPGQAGLVKFIKLPPVEKKRIPDIVKFEAKQQIPFALDEVVWAYQQIGDDDEEGGDDDFMMAEVGLFAMKRDQIARAILPLTVAGIEVDVVQMAPIALYNYITYDQIKGSGSKDSVVVLDIGVDNTDLIISDGVRIWQRNIPIGGNHFTRALTKELKLTFAKAEHLKRNATKAPDPRAIFTAMRGVFNDFASEVNRSIGFYSSINRTAKIRKIVGLGNGFKLPGLQKFLQQNLSQEVEKLDEYKRLEGDEVKAAPQFQDNLASFAVAYGLALQGAGLSALRTNLLPPEIERIRMIRAKKPWALAASALVMLGLSSLFVLGDYRALAKISTPQFNSAVEQATSVSKNGSTIKSGLETAKSEWQAKYDEGKALIIDPSNKGMWPAFLKTISNYFPDPVAEYNLKPDDPKNEYLIEKLRVHIDRIMPVWRTDLAVDWFDELDPLYKRLMHPYDAENPPSGEGWIVQIVGHHYNPYPTTPDQQRLAQASPDDPARVDFGPYEFLLRKVLRKLNSPSLRLYGVTHVALAWMNSDKNWTSEKGSATNNLASRTVPLLDRAAPPVEESGGMGEMGMMGAMMGSGMMGPGGMGSGMMGGRGGRMGEMGGMPGMEGGMMGMMGPGGMMGSGYGRRGMGTGADAEKDIRKLTRTDFLLQFVWVPPAPTEEDKAKTPEELLEARKAELLEITTKMIEAEKGKSAVTVPVEAEIEKASTKQSDEIDSEINKALSAPAAGAAGAPAGKETPAAPAAPTEAAPKS
ncbi:type IV pilus assembly protein PilM [Planctomyces sp. SH-PL62]|uniref:type IV pilus assembly protein PilM n=1 Tax=Planctomyces sp. SH-PL62 TaxID=1636152 RepID=UPI00078CDCAE|nr:type IV pilus assembly protein PilM [Planctomyces sp. SH-PL62]AMV37656.1 Competence protein A [Planctomyces sp. SH-PL62]